MSTVFQFWLFAHLSIIYWWYYTPWPHEFHYWDSCIRIALRERIHFLFVRPIFQPNEADKSPWNSYRKIDMADTPRLSSSGIDESPHNFASLGIAINNLHWHFKTICNFQRKSRLFHLGKLMHLSNSKFYWAV